MINENYSFLVALLGGFTLGIIFFYGLWMTLEKITTSKTPVRWLFFSGLTRVCISLVGFYFIVSLNSNGQLTRLLLSLLGFLIARLTVSKMTQVRPEVKRAP